MKRVLFFWMSLYVMACSCPSCLKKNNFSTMDLLTRTNWYLDTEGTLPNLIIKRTYDKQQYQDVYLFKDDSKKHNSSSVYYLSDSIDSIFKPEKVGQKEYGKYIITEKESVLEIIKLCCDTLIVKAIRTDTIIRIGGGYPVLYVSSPPRLKKQ